MSFDLACLMTLTVNEPLDHETHLQAIHTLDDQGYVMSTQNRSFSLLRQFTRVS